MPDTIRLQSFDLVTQNIADANLDALHALSIGVGWPHRRSDWDLLRSLGRGVAALDDIGRVFSTAMWFGHGETSATIGMVITSPRVQSHGGGRWMMDRILRECGERNLILNSTRAAYKLYLSLGFEFQAIVHQIQGVVGPSPRPTSSEAEGIEAMTPGDLPALLSLDAAAFGADRTVVLSRIAPLARIVGLRRNGQWEGYAMRRSFGRGQLIGPVVAQSEEDAIRLVAAHLSDLEGRFARIDTRQPDGPFREFLQGAGLTVYDTVKTLTRGVPLAKLQVGRASIYALAAQPLG